MLQNPLNSCRRQVGARTVHELDENVAMSRVRIPPGLWDELRVRGLIAQAAPTNARIVA